MAAKFLAAAAAPNPLIPHWPELIIGAIAFLIVFALLAKVLMPRISKTLAERTDAIEGGLKRAEDAQTEANKVLEQYRAQLADARHEAARLREQAKEEAAQIVAQGRADGVAERQRIIDSANAQIEADRQQALTALRAEVGSAGGRAGQPDRRRVAGRPGQAVPHGRPVPGRTRRPRPRAGSRPDERREQGVAERGQGAAGGRAGRRRRRAGDAGRRGALRRGRPARRRARAAPQPVRSVQ